jgi:hypothetical protein
MASKTIEQKLPMEAELPVPPNSCRFERLYSGSCSSLIMTDNNVSRIQPQPDQTFYRKVSISLYPPSFQP